jgi:condensin complex subunit 3
MVAATTTLQEAIPHLFDDAQRSATSHRKNAQALRQLLRRHSDPTAYFTEFSCALNRLMGLKKRDPTIERSVKFVTAFIGLLQESDDDSGESVFTELYLGYLIRGMNAKDKVVRLRSCQLVAVCVDMLRVLSEDVYAALIKNVMVRVRDKEAAIRVQALIALSKLHVRLWV